MLLIELLTFDNKKNKRNTKIWIHQTKKKLEEITQKFSMEIDIKNLTGEIIVGKQDELGNLDAANKKAMEENLFNRKKITREKEQTQYGGTIITCDGNPEGKQILDNTLAECIEKIHQKNVHIFLLSADEKTVENFKNTLFLSEKYNFNREISEGQNYLYCFTLKTNPSVYLYCTLSVLYRHALDKMLTNFENHIVNHDKTDQDDIIKEFANLSLSPHILFKKTEQLANSQEINRVATAIDDHYTTRSLNKWSS